MVLGYIKWSYVFWDIVNLDVYFDNGSKDVVGFFDVWKLSYWYGIYYVFLWKRYCFVGEI